MAIRQGYLQPPSFENNYYVRFRVGAAFTEKERLAYYHGADVKCHDEYTNELWKPIITPYIPTVNEDLITKIKEKVLLGEIKFFSNPSHSDVLTNVCTFLSLSDLFNFSEVNSLCYLVTKSDHLWKCQLQKLYPQVKCLDKDKCSFNPEGQFQIVFKRIQQDKRPFVLQMREDQMELEKELDDEHSPPMKKRRLDLDTKLLVELSNEDSFSFKQVVCCKLALQSIPKRYDDQILFEAVINESEKKLKRA